eukprot:CAMPEP_0169384064 /NCGR_PEP_ID=MMETSP1017-20121227/43189_1 /TAXON_ID=342587 /ORGANISM="Karlodinium micrum, Strain CCMP2283" /LENGTH=352 /DNA_ID=CAMNT_0009484519 /DNA_START=67 /DNA_END=1127 /DNA_ORIENTATION=+
MKLQCDLKSMLACADVDGFLGEGSSSSSSSSSSLPAWLSLGVKPTTTEVDVIASLCNDSGRRCGERDGGVTRVGEDIKEDNASFSDFRNSCVPSPIKQYPPSSHSRSQSPSRVPCTTSPDETCPILSELLAFSLRMLWRDAEVITRQALGGSCLAGDGASGVVTDDKLVEAVAGCVGASVPLKSPPSTPMHRCVENVILDGLRAGLRDDYNGLSGAGLGAGLRDGLRSGVSAGEAPRDRHGVEPMGVVIRDDRPEASVLEQAVDGSSTNLLTLPVWFILADGAPRSARPAARSAASREALQRMVSNPRTARAPAFHAASSGAGENAVLLLDAEDELPLVCGGDRGLQERLPL